MLAELQQVASGLGIRGTARMRKSQLIEVIKEAQAGGGDPAAKVTPAPSEGNTSQSTDAAEQQPESQSRRARFNAFGVRAISLGTQLLPAAARERWQEEWRAEWADVVEQRRRARLMFLVRLTFSSAPRLAWSLRRSSQREPA